MARTAKSSGDYPIEHIGSEVERLAVQNRVWAGEAATLLDSVGVAEGWRCLDIGCGPGGITHELAARVGKSGHVLGLDYNPEFVAIARRNSAPNTDFRQGDAYATGLEGASFDLVHTRFLASTAGQPERLVSEARRLVRSGGYIAYQEAAFDTLNSHPPHPAWIELARLFSRCFPEPGAEPIAHRMYRLLHDAGLRDLVYRPCIAGIRSTDAWRDYLPSTMESMRGTVTRRLGVSNDRLDELLAACRAHLADPATVFSSYTCVQCWGRAP